jgi:Flp pilus assembly protein TadD
MCKQVMVTAPIVVFVYDWIFFSNSAREAFSKRWGLYLGMTLTWIPLAAFVIAAPQIDTAGFGVAALRPRAYFRSEFEVVCYYIRLALWPNSLSLDYFWPVANSVSRVLPYGLLLTVLVAATLWALLKRKPVAFLGVWFFGILAVTSSFMPIADLACDHRMYLPLASVIVFVVLGVQELIDRVLAQPSVVSGAAPPKTGFASVALAGGVIAVAVFATIGRNVDYQFPIAMWMDVIKKSPDNPRAHGSLGMHLIEAGRLDEAVAELNTAIALRPGYIGAEADLGRALVLAGHEDAALPHLLYVLRSNPNHSAANLYLGRVLMQQGRLQEAVSCLNRAVTIEPTYAEAHYFLAVALSKEGREPEAQAEYATTARLWPGLVEQLSSAQEANP